MNPGDWRWDMQNQLPVGEAIVTVICASNKTQLIDFSRNQHAWPLYLMIGNNRKIICQIPKTIAWIPVGGFPVLPTGGKIQRLHGILQLAQCCGHIVILT
jgi:hypothetical protein